MKTNIVNKHDYNTDAAKRAYVKAALANGNWNDDVPYTIEQLELDTDSVLEADRSVDEIGGSLQDLIYAAEYFFEGGDKFNTEMLLDQVHERKYN